MQGGFRAKCFVWFWRIAGRDSFAVVMRRRNRDAGRRGMSLATPAEAAQIKQNKSLGRLTTFQATIAIKSVSPALANRRPLSEKKETPAS